MTPDPDTLQIELIEVQLRLANIEWLIKRKQHDVTFLEELRKRIVAVERNLLEKEAQAKGEQNE